MDSGHYTVIAGGSGAAKFLRGLIQVVPEDRIHVIVNVGDDTDIWGLHISPDIDSIVYGLSGRLDPVRGWGLRDETFRCLEAMRSYDMPSWFRLGDADLATHLARTELLRSGMNLTTVVERMAKALGVRARILPATTAGSGAPPWNDFHTSTKTAFTYYCLSRVIWSKVLQIRIIDVSGRLNHFAGTVGGHLGLQRVKRSAYHQNVVRLISKPDYNIGSS